MPISMSDKSFSSAIKLQEVQIGGFSLGSAILLIVAAGLMALQTASVLDGINPDKSFAIQFLPGVVAIALGAWVALRMRRKGHLTVFLDHVEGIRSNGSKILVQMEGVATVDLKARAIALKDAQGGLLLVQQLPQKGDGGLLWLLHAYGTWDLPIWQAYPNCIGDLLPKATRHFLASDGSVGFGDIGFLIEVGDQKWFFPESPTVNIQGLGAGQLRMYQRASANAETQLQFQPQPDWLPMSRFCKAIADSTLDLAQKTSLIEALAENHGGCLVGQLTEDGEFDAEYLGYVIKIYPAEQANG
jgi:hypothetical protein